ncbi:MAG: hypothetical protein PHR36_02305 [Patescibacteria group bacterium]|nr:hypothetical protein [Patescibacteria group bacterium]
MAIAAQEQGLLVKKSHPGVNPEECLKCGYLFKYFAGASASEGGKYAGVCICAKTGKGTGPACQAT